MKEVAKIFAYFAAVVLLGALLAPLFYWGVHAIEPWALANGLIKYIPPPDTGQPAIGGPLGWLDADFQKIFHRMLLLAAVLLLRPAWRWMGGGSLRNVGLAPDPRARLHLAQGLLIGGGLVALMAGVYVFCHIYHFKERLPWGALGQIALSAAVVGMIEEWLFRGAIMGLFLRAMRPMPALAWTTFIFAALHFLRSGDDPGIGPVKWYSALALLPKLFHPFAEPMMLLAGFATLFTLGWLLGYARLRTGALWMSIGLHAGVVFVKMGFAKFTRRDELYLPWVGSELQIGVVPIAVLLVGLYLVWRRMEYEELLPNPSRRS
ncbi:MAG TPA: CPBP family intramembrane glutamic endopeptidase [Chthoniobacteraceae bacterium]|nr:CPBP family intramembrane glutamic endopeptidase [Chthoniobacteraceae bacterium]